MVRRTMFVLFISVGSRAQYLLYSSHTILDKVKIMYGRPAVSSSKPRILSSRGKAYFNIGTILQTRPDVTLWVHYYILPIWNIHRGYYGCGPPPKS